MNENPYQPPESSLGPDISERSYTEASALNLLRHWNGRARLATAFWGHFIAGNILFSVVSLVFNAIINNFIWSQNLIISSLQLGLGLIGFIYSICTIRFVWACARNSSYSGFFYIARGLILLLIISLIGMFSVTFYEAYISF